MSNWIPILSSITEDSGTFTARITWVNNVEGKKSSQDIPLIGIKNLEQFNTILRSNRDNKLDTSIELVKQLSGLTGQELPIEAVVIDPTPEQLAKLEYDRQYFKLQRIKNVTDLSITPDTSLYDAQLKLVQQLFLPEYVD